MATARLASAVWINRRELFSKSSEKLLLVTSKIGPLGREPEVCVYEKRLFKDLV